MAAVLKHWREASTLILVTSRQHGISVAPVLVGGSNVNTAKGRDLPRGADYELLLLKRSPKSSFMPNQYVFPGGVAVDADFSAEWLGVFDYLGRDQRQNIFDFVQRGGQGPPMFSRIRDQKFSHIPSEVAFRICAIRETFEESGVLLVRDATRVRDNLLPTLWDKPSVAEYVKNQSLISEWRSKVDENPEEFLRMCRILKLVPDIWSLYEWSNWLTPHFDLKRRYDTAFFICCVEGRPHAQEDAGETVHSQWASPFAILSQYKEGKASIAPPQLYESCRLIRFNLSELLKFSWQRSQQRVERWMPARIGCADAYVMLLPGDSLYPADIKPEGPVEEVTYRETITELSCSYPRMHRMIMSGEAGKKKPFFACNIELPGNYVFPLNQEAILQHLESLTPSSSL